MQWCRSDDQHSVTNAVYEQMSIPSHNSVKHKARESFFSQIGGLCKLYVGATLNDDDVCDRYYDI
jgi:hypothetical protein